MNKAKIEIRSDVPVIIFPCGGCRPCGHAEYEIIKELESEKAELIDALKTTYDFNDHWGIGNYHRWNSDFQNKVEKLIQKHTGE